jgi:hypothetical protein
MTFQRPESNYEPILHHRVVGALIASAFALTVVAIAVLFSPHESYPQIQRTQCYSPVDDFSRFFICPDIKP